MFSGTKEVIPVKHVKILTQRDVSKSDSSGSDSINVDFIEEQKYEGSQFDNMSVMGIIRSVKQKLGINAANADSNSDQNQEQNEAPVSEQNSEEVM